MFKALSDAVPRDRDYPERQHRLNMLGRVLDGSLYDHLQYPFSMERVEGTGEYIPIHRRRPSARYRLCGTVVDDSVSLLFSDGRFPTITCEDEETREAIAKLVIDAKIGAAMIEAATIGAVGSVCLWLRILSGRVFLKPLRTEFLTPEFDPENPDTLIKVTERYKVRGDVLAAMGYAIDDDDLAAMFWFQRAWDDQAETWFVPAKVSATKRDTVSAIDTARSVDHQLGFCPMVWVRNLPGGDDVDGSSTMVREALDTQIEIDYQLSQAGRGLRYAADPTLLIKQPAVGAEPIVRSASQALVVDSDGDAKLLEINGTASEAVMNYVRGLRELALESLHGNRANADKISAAQSGRAMELMNQSLIWLSDKLRTSYGDGGLLPIIRMIIAASAMITLVDDDGNTVMLAANKPVALRWPKWFSPTYADGLTQAQTFAMLLDNGMMSRETAVASLAAEYDIDDPAAELARIKADMAEAQQAQIDMQAANSAQTAGQLPKGSKPPLNASDD